MKIKKYILLIISLILFIGNINIVKADEACTREAATQMAKIIWRESGAQTALDKDDNFFEEITTAGVILNIAYTTKGDTWYEKIYNMTDNNYERYSTYKDLPFEEVVDSRYQSRMLYMAELVLTGKYNLPQNMMLSASPSIVEMWGRVWCHVPSTGSYDTYFGYTGGDLKDTDIFGKKISDTTPEYYRKLAKSLDISDYSAYTPKTVCGGLSSSVTPNVDDDKVNINKKPVIILNACENPDVLRIIYFIKILIDIVKIVVPIGLIIMSTIDFSKSVTTNDENIQKKVITLFGKRIIVAVLIFIVPWIAEVVMVALGDLTKDVNFTDCLQNANKEKIEALENNLNNLNNNQGDQNTQGDRNTYDYIVYIGDSRTAGMCNSVNLSSKEDCTIVKIGAGYSWLTSTDTKNKIKNILNAHPNSYVVINMGTNSSLQESDASNFATLYNSLSKDYPNSKFVAVSVTQIDHTLAKNNGYYSNININSNSVKLFNTYLKNKLDTKIMYCDVYSKMENYDYVATDGVHYNTDTYKFIYNEIQNCLK